MSVSPLPTPARNVGRPPKQPVTVMSIWRVTCTENPHVVYDVRGVLAPLSCPRCGSNAAIERIEPRMTKGDDDRE